MAKADEIKARIGLSGPPLQPLPSAPPAVPDHEIVRCIGRGSYGEVWLARNAVGTWRAIKVVHRANFKDARPYEREFAGIQKYEPISRANEGLVDVLHIGRNDAEGYFYYVMELADDAGGLDQISSEQFRVASNQYSISSDQFAASYSPRTLAREIHSRGRLPVEECITLGLTLNLALGHLHRHGLIHRDVKPSNIIFVNGVPKLADIGLVTDTAEAQSFVGTEGFIPPEGPNSTQADLYALGKAIYEAAMGKDRQEFPEPFTNLGVDAESRALMELNEVLLKACADKPTQRYQTAEEMNADLALLHSGKSVQSKHALERRLKLMTRIGLGALAVMLLGFVPYYFAVREAHQARIEAEKSRQVAQVLKDMIGGVEPSVAKGRDTTMLREILDKTAERVGKDLTKHPEVELELRFVLADAYAALGQTSRQQELARGSLQLARARLGDENLVVANALDQLGMALYTPHPAQAEEFLRQALAMRIRLLGKEHVEVATSLDHLANLLKDRGKLAEAESFHRDGLAMRLKLLGPEHLDVARSRHNLATVLVARGKLPEAESMFRQVMEKFTKDLGNDHPFRATVLLNLAGILQTQGKMSEAETMQLEALALRRKLNGNEHQTVAGALEALAETLDKEGKLAEAETNFLQALAMQRKLEGNEHPFVAYLLTHLAGTLIREGKLEEAETMSREALPIREKAFGPGHEAVAESLNTLGIVLEERGKVAEAEPLFRRAVAIQRNLLGKGNVTPFFTALLYNLAEALRELAQYEEAKTLFHELAERGDAEAQISLGQMYQLGQGTAKDPLEAVKWYRKAAESGSIHALNMVAWFLATCEDPTLRDGRSAIAFAEKVVAATDRKDPGALDTLAAAYAEARDFDKAIATQKQAMDLLRDEETKKDFTSRLELYGANIPYREHN